MRPTRTTDYIRMCLLKRIIRSCSNDSLVSLVCLCLCTIDFRLLKIGSALAFVPKREHAPHARHTQVSTTLTADRELQINKQPTKYINMNNPRLQLCAKPNVLFLLSSLTFSSFFEYEYKWKKINIERSECCVSFMHELPRAKHTK